MSRLVVLLAAAAVAALLVAGSASAWQYKFHDFFEFKGNAIAAGLAKARKCGGGSKLGTYDYRSLVTASGGETELEVEVTAELSVREQFRHMKKIEVAVKGSPNIPAQIVDEVGAALHDFHQTVFTRWKPGKLLVKHGSLELFGREVVAPGESKTEFHPKPGC